MTDDFVPEADAVEQEQEVDTPAVPETQGEADVSVEAVEADEADVLEQTQLVPDDDGYDGR